MFSRKLNFSIAKLSVILILMNEVTAIPLPFRENPSFGIPRPEQVTVQRRTSGPPDDQTRFRRQPEERPMNQNPGHSSSFRNDQRRHPNIQNVHAAWEQQNIFESYNHQNPYQQQQQPPPVPSRFGTNENHHRETRDAFSRIQLNDWQIQSDGKQHPNPSNSFREARSCSSPDCMEKYSGNNIRNEFPNDPSSYKIPSVHTNGHGPALAAHNKLQFPSMQLTPPPPEPQQSSEKDQNEEGPLVFYGHQYGLPIEVPSHSNNAPATLPEGHGQFTKNPITNSTEQKILTLRASSIAIGDSFEIVRIEIDVSDAADNGETDLEIEDQ